MYESHYEQGSGLSSAGDKVQYKSGTPYSSPYKPDMYDKMTFEKKTVTKPAKAEGMQGAASTQTQDKSQKVMVSGNDGKADYGKGNPFKGPLTSIKQLRDLVKHKLG